MISFDGLSKSPPRMSHNDDPSKLNKRATCAQVSDAPYGALRKEL